MTARIVAFDLDGTLVDSVADIHAALAATLAPEHAITLPMTRELVGRGARHLVEGALRAFGEDPSSARVDDVLARFRAAYDATPIGSTHAFAGIPDALRALAELGFVLAVATNKPAPLARVVVDALLPGIALVLGPEDAALKPDPAILDVIEARLGGAVVAFVGDSVVDRDTAAAKGVPFIPVGWGLGARDTLAADPGDVVDDPRALVARVCALVG